MFQFIRIFDILVALIALTLLCPILFIIPALILLDDGGPIFFSQTRLGKHKKSLTLWKFRTMRNGKITRVGKWLRASALDEFLQFFLILSGSMSIVGPRPLTQDDVTRLGWDDEEHASRWSVIPGITGLVQIYGGSSSAHSWKLETYYLQHQSFALQLKIIILSAMINICGKRRIKTWFPIRTEE